MKQAEKIRSKIQAIVADKSQVSATYRVADDSVQAELRFRAQWSIRLAVDTINYPKELNPDYPNKGLWERMRQIDRKISATATLLDHKVPGEYAQHIIAINARRKNGEALRAEAKQAWEIETGKQFLAEYRAVTKKSRLAAIRKQIAALQAEQKIIIPQLREFNSQYLASRRAQSQERARKNAEAIASGRFWEADKETLKNYFHPPFDKNYLADVSAKWRAALFLECESVSFRLYSDNWGHKLAGTGRGYLCGIDDNGDEWGHRVDDLPQSLDNYNNAALDSTVEEAMAQLFGVDTAKLPECTRQGDLLFCSVTLKKQPWETDRCRNCGQEKIYHEFAGVDCKFEPKIGQPIELHPHEGPYEIRESHEILSTGLTVNGGRYFASQNPIYVRHTSHPMQTLPPGEYRLYELQIADAD